MLRVLFEFQACDDDEIAVRRGELVKVLNKDDQDWWWVENAHGEQGFVPRNFLWPCGCYVCQKFILDKVSKDTDCSPTYQDKEQGRSQSSRGFSVGSYTECDANTKLIGNRRYTRTWC
ncbi:unnamed protein product [Porites lobata]|uniref:SH3 domain-containing protein n=1 Tax=Porites lobata TaxID=104759 RepID=A0ABN8NR64_9CNID|nr:unnamed protein product [Porites lobata]